MAKDLKAAIKRKPAQSAPRMPDIRIAAPQAHVDVPVTVDTKALAQEVSQLAAVMTQLAKQQEAILSAMQEQVQVLNVLARREVNVSVPEVKVPAMKMPARPSTYDIEFNRAGGETVGMRITAPTARGH